MWTVRDYRVCYSEHLSICLWITMIFCKIYSTGVETMAELQGLVSHENGFWDLIRKIPEYLRHSSSISVVSVKINLNFSQRVDDFIHARSCADLLIDWFCVTAEPSDSEKDLTNINVSLLERNRNPHISSHLPLTPSSVFFSGIVGNIEKNNRIKAPEVKYWFNPGLGYFLITFNSTHKLSRNEGIFLISFWVGKHTDCSCDDVKSKNK